MGPESAVAMVGLKLMADWNLLNTMRTVSGSRFISSSATWLAVVNVSRACGPRHAESDGPHDDATAGRASEHPR